MTEAAWLGYTPADQETIGHMRRLFRKLGIEPLPHFAEWSTEFARDVYQALTAMAAPGVAEAFRAEGYDPDEEVLKLAVELDVWSTDPAVIRWAPASTP